MGSMCRVWWMVVPSQGESRADYGMFPEFRPSGCKAPLKQRMSGSLWLLVWSLKERPGFRGVIKTRGMQPPAGSLAYPWAPPEPVALDLLPSGMWVFVPTPSHVWE